MRGQGFGANFLPVQKATFGTGSRRPKAWAVLQLHGVSVRRGQKGLEA